MWTPIFLFFLLSVCTCAASKQMEIPSFCYDSSKIKNPCEDCSYQIEYPCYCHARYQDQGDYVDIFSSPTMFELGIEDCSEVIECKRNCYEVYETSGNVDLSRSLLLGDENYGHLGQLLCSALADRGIMDVQNKTVELFFQVCDGPMLPTNSESKGKDFCCAFGKFVSCKKD